MNPEPETLDPMQQKKPHADPYASAWGFTITPSVKLFGRSSGFPAFTTAFPMQWIASVALTMHLDGCRSCKGSLWCINQKAGLQRRVRSGFTPDSLFAHTGDRKALYLSRQRGYFKKKAVSMAFSWLKYQTMLLNHPLLLAQPEGGKHNGKRRPQNQTWKNLAWHNRQNTPKKSQNSENRKVIDYI
jgi:hypothetical protein